MTWEETEKEVTLLVQNISEKPDVIVGIARGGLVPARLLSRNLNVRMVYVLSVIKVGEERKVMTEICDDLTGRKLLLVEDVLESGDSLEAGKQYLESKGAIVKTASLYVTSQTKVKPDYYLKEVDTPPQFPWE